MEQFYYLVELLVWLSHGRTRVLILNIPSLPKKKKKKKQKTKNKNYFIFFFHEMMFDGEFARFSKSFIPFYISQEKTISILASRLSFLIYSFPFFFFFLRAAITTIIKHQLRNSY